MSSLNKVMVLGNLGRDPELKEKGETKWVNLSVATTDGYGDKQTTEWHNVTAFGKVAENVAKYKKKGDTVFIEGRLQTDTYEKDGEKRYATKIIASSIQFVGGKKNGDAETVAALDNIDF